MHDPFVSLPPRRLPPRRPPLPLLLPPAGLKSGCFSYCSWEEVESAGKICYTSILKPTHCRCPQAGQFQYEKQEMNQ